MLKQFLSPKEIEKKSLKIIESKVGNLGVTREKKEIIMRVAHATADIEIAKGIIFHPQAIEKGILAIRTSRDIITDVEMVKAGIRIKELKNFGNRIFCFLNDEKVEKEAKDKNLPRARLAIRRAASHLDDNIVVIGNAPTALFELLSLIKEGKVSPALVIGTPVGFVGAAESKKALRKISVPYITNKSRKGGSAVACAIINAIIKLAIR
ncbi:MAG: precorrin-8X methylmutase [Candidatus Hydrogenedentota bacterium]